MLSKFDDYPIHQTPEPIAHRVSSERNLYDRYWYNGYDRDGEFYIGIAIALYPNLGILDCGFSIVRDGEQHAFHASCRAPQEPSDLTVGPFRLEILEPMRSNRLVIEKNETGIECDLTFIPRTANVEEGYQKHRNARSVVMEATRFAQYGFWQGSVKYDGKELKVDPSRVYATKDRSWGQRPLGDPAPPGAPIAAMPQAFFLWAPLHWEDQCTHFGVFEDEKGFMWHADAQIVPAYATPEQIPGVTDPATQIWGKCEHRIEYVKGTRVASSADIAMISKTGERLDIQLEPLILYRMKGSGYSHPTWGHGQWKGELAVSGEMWKCDDAAPLALENQHIQQVVRARCGDRVGVGVLEQICIGPHATYGFKEFLDGAA